MALKKSQLYSSLWQSCDELRGGMDASQYKDYVLTLLFMKYVSDKHASDPDALIEVPDGGGFDDMAKLKGDKEIGDRINKIISRLAEANGLKGVIDQADFNDESKLGTGKEMQDRLSKLVAIFEELDFSANRVSGDDLLGDAYEYLMRHFATESGKSKGQFYTPAEVSRIMAKVVGIGPDTRQDQTIYDPTCGSGSLLLKAADEAPRGITVYGQEMDNATWSLARMNLILHGQETAEIWSGNTLAAPHFKNSSGSLKTFDFAVANPPFSTKAWSNGLDPEHDQYGRFVYGVPPAKNGDYAYLLHLITSLKSRGKGAIILPHGVLFRGNREADIRRNLVQRGLIKGIIGLPANLFYGTGIPACIVVIDKEGAATREGIFMVDASRGFIKDGNKNRLREQDIHRVVDVFTRQTETPRYSRLVPLAEISDPANDYNLNLPRYIDSSEPEDLHDLEAHLRGGIPNRDIDALGEYWQVFPNVRDALFAENGRAGYSTARIEARKVKAAILDHQDFQSYARLVENVASEWCEAHQNRLLEINATTEPKALIGTLSEDLLRRFSDLPLLDAYDIYQCLMDYWNETMQDDAFLVVGEGWFDAAQPRGIVEDRKRKFKETPDLIVKKRKYKLDLIPPALVVARYFAAEQRTVETLQEKRDIAAGDLEEFIEEHIGEEGLLEGTVNDKGKLTKANVSARLKAIEAEPGSSDERQTLERGLALVEAESKASRVAKKAQADLDAQVFARYAALSESEIKSLVVVDKWLVSIRNVIDAEVQRLIQRLGTRLQEIEERYARPLPELERDVEAYSAKVNSHLARMGISL
ncbi:MAG: SAM-dependent DNA methyltransferase [Gammaproteobacteria bacterium]|nr:SAM-dependent DNA methyltransferase [Gammaproteobacteria bacterium]MYE51678.1 SAM-dependent DNA methyltransferase [Gammaproteobacteria bacterium]MYF10955.1 SAM-dependent DNA methyltransferase [Gammaproteobacteria bacterium]MYH17346.1 SAM-dependent DNA methyltransferase [Gammaproteobacteria bacterium]MYK83381.1 SAM-dependent DNA methyltransferase [Gammaproteobacteria bacterium]